MFLTAAIGPAIVACGPAKEDAKGEVDDSAPPALPLESGKADDAARTIDVDAESPHPYANNVDRVFQVSLAGLPSCASRARLHFAVLRTEAGYDFVTVEPAGEPAQSFDGTHDNTWTEWFDINASSVAVRLETDSSITRHGFEIDKVEWDGAPSGCSNTGPACGAGTVDLAPRADVCECPAAPQCASIANIEVSYSRNLGFNFNTKHVKGAIATETNPGPADGPETKEVGTVDTARLASLVRRAVDTGVLASPGYTKPIATGTFRTVFEIKAGAEHVTFIASQGAHTADVQALINEFEALFTCDGNGGLTCGDDFTCDEGVCREDQGCVCPAVYMPVCGNNGQTYSNDCAAACANVGVAHDGECGVTGDVCGTLLGLPCQDDFKCRYAEGTFTAPWPDASGTCVAANYCDAPPDCAGLPHIAVPGSWACVANTCEWEAGAAWQTVSNGRFETAHPYANSTSVWKQLWLPAGAEALRLVTASFSLERDYDFLEVWTWNGADWVRVRRYTGTAGPALGDEFPGRYHYLRFVSDSSVTAPGFVVDAEWR